jgi:protein-disulfide isomerase
MLTSSRRSALLASVLALAACAAPPATPASVATSKPSTVEVPSGDRNAAANEGATGEQAGDPGPIPVSPADPSRGDTTALVTIVEFSDFQCPFCQRLVVTLRQLEDEYGPSKLRIVWKNYPLPFHAAARPAADAAMASFAQGGQAAFWRVHDQLFRTQPRSPEDVAGALRSAGITPESLAPFVQSAAAKVAEDMELAKRVGVSGTPASFVNGVYLSGAQPIDHFREVIDDQLEKAEALVKAGMPRSRIYAYLAQQTYVERPQPPAPKPVEVDKNVYRVPVGASPVRGSATALVTIVEFADFQCPFCARAEPTLVQLQREYGDKLRVVFKNDPLPFHPRAEPASELALEARAQKGDAAFWTVHDALFANQTHLEDADLATLATRAGLDAKRAMAAVQKKKHTSVIEADQDLADDVHATGTPHFFINGRRLVGAQSIETFRKLVDEQLAVAEAEVQHGTPAAKVYDALQKNAKAPDPPEQKTVPAPTKASPSRGPMHAKVVVQVFSDFECPFCKRMMPTLDELEKAFPGKIRIVWRNKPLPMHRHAKMAAEVAMEAFAQKGSAGFWKMEALLYDAQSTASLERPDLERMAAEAGLDMRRLTAALDGHTHEAAIEADSQIADDAGITGTPGTVINGYFISGAQPLSKFKKLVARALAEAK